MQPTLETEIVKAHTRLDGVDARLKKIERKLDRVVWYAGIVCGVAAVVSGRVMRWLGV
jgi:hypothetical protein